MSKRQILSIAVLSCYVIGFILVCSGISILQAIGVFIILLGHNAEKHSDSLDFD